MKSIKVSILGKQFPLKVEDSEEETMKRIAHYVDDKFRQYKKELNKQPDTTVMSLAPWPLLKNFLKSAGKIKSSVSKRKK